MGTYIVLFRYTEQGLRKVKDSPQRVGEAKAMFRAAGAEVKQFYALMGRYDTMFILEAPDDESAAKGALAVASLGNVRTETIRAFTEDEFRKIAAG